MLLVIAGFVVLLINKINCTDYYAAIDVTASDDDLKVQLQNLISIHIVLTYDDIWNAFSSIDKNLPGYPCDGNASHIPDVYSSYCWAPEKLPLGGECGNYKKEGDCYNREHLWPKSWFGGFDNGEDAQTDLFELWPSDGYVNGKRGDLPLGEVEASTVTYTSTNLSLIGKCEEDNSSQCFEPAQVFKGDFARSYFYLATAYFNKASYIACLAP
jgi:endonuclease I